MESWRTALRRGIDSGVPASVASTLVLAAAGKAETGSAAAPTNATSHWLWGAPATRVDRADWRHTALGYGIHHVCSVFWAVLYERYRPSAHNPTPARVLRDATATAAIACFVDYQLTPPRLRPGFEQRLSRPALALVYGAFALGLAAAALLAARRERPVARPATIRPPLEARRPPRRRPEHRYARSPR